MRDLLPAWRWSLRRVWERADAVTMVLLALLILIVGLQLVVILPLEKLCDAGRAGQAEAARDVEAALQNAADAESQTGSALHSLLAVLPPAEARDEQMDALGRQALHAGVTWLGAASCAVVGALNSTDTGAVTVMGGLVATVRSTTYALEARDVGAGLRSALRVADDIPAGYIAAAEDIVASTEKAAASLNKTATRIGILGVTAGTISYFDNMRNGKYGDAALSAADTTMTLVGMTSPIGAGISLVYFGSRYAYDKFSD